MTFHKYEKKRDVLKLIGTAFLEPLFFHPLTVVWAIKGNWDFLRGKRGWGKMEREGFYSSVAPPTRKTAPPGSGPVQTPQPTAEELEITN
jgi:poly-beta-1,6-N-acetyl-D-glucosamine synthase